MNDFVIQNISNFNKKNLDEIGFDSSYAKIAAEKYLYKNLKIFGLTLPQANILKQTALSIGADCALHKEVLTAKIDKTDCVLGATHKQLQDIIQKLQSQPFHLKELAQQIEKEINFQFKSLQIKNKTFDFSRPYITGILNLTQNSFSDGGQFYEFEPAKKHLLQLIQDGADIIDIGAESTKPFSTPVPVQEQLDKLIPILEFIKTNGIDIPISIDTRSSIVAEECIKAGADIINDVSGTEYDEKIADVTAKYDKIFVIQHSNGTPETMQKDTEYKNLLDDIFISLNKKIKKALSKGIKREKIIIDPGIGFGKTQAQNFEILNNIQNLYSLHCPVTVGISRKSLLDMSDASNEEKDIYTLALNSSLIDKKVNFLRVHNVKFTKKLLDLKISTH